MTRGSVFRLARRLGLLLLAVVAAGLHCAVAQEKRVLRNAWDPFVPFAYIETENGFNRWTGLDVELLRAIAERAGYLVESEELAWAIHVKEIAEGKKDLAAAATQTPERDAFALFTKPYRQESIALVVRKGMAEQLPALNDVELVNMFRETGFRLGVQEGIAFPSAAIRAFIDDPANREQIVSIEEHQELLQSLLDGRVNGFLADRIAAATIVWMNDMQSEVEEHPLKIEGDLRIMFSRATVPQSTVDDFNRAIDSIRNDGTFNRINQDYMFPILLAQTLDSDWFLIIDLLGTAAFALSGILLAYKYNYDIFGALVLASLPAVGGGVVRDLITNRETVGVLSNPIYVFIIVGLVVAGFILLRVGNAMQRAHVGAPAMAHFKRFQNHANYIVQVFDAIGLAAFTVTGVVVALGTRSEPLWLWGPILAAFTAAGGGILRDVLRAEPDIPSLKGELYPEIAVFWGWILSMYLIWQTRQLNPEEILFGIVVTVIGAFLTRMAVIHFHIRSPRFSIRRADAPGE